MIGQFQAYIKTIAAFLILAVFVEMIMPNGGFKKYVSLFMGFLLMIALLKPIDALFREKNLEIQDIFGQKEVAAAFSYDTSSYAAEENNLVTDIYKEDLALQITSTLQENGFPTASVTVKVEEQADSPNYGMIQQISVNVGSVNEQEKWEDKKNAVTVAPFEPIERIGETERFYKEPSDGEESEKEKQMKKLLNRVYQIEPEHIVVSFADEWEEYQ